MSLYAGETLERFQPHFELLFGSNGDLIGIQNPRANGADLRFSADGGTITTGGVNIASGGSFNLYNTTPISSTNYERLRMDWSSNIARMWTQNNGTGSPLNLRVGVAAADGNTTPPIYTMWQGTALPLITHQILGGTGAGTWHEMGATTNSLAGSSGTQTAVAVSPTYAQTGTAAGIAFLVNPSGTYGSGGGNLQEWQFASAGLARINSAGTFESVGYLRTTSGLSFTSSYLGASDLEVYRDAADTLALRRSTNAQTFRVYNTYTDASNYERLSFRFPTGTDASIYTENLGTGTARGIYFGTNTTARWFLQAAGHWVAVTDNTYDIGASGATRPRTGYFAGSIVTGTAATLHTTSTALTDYAAAAAGTLGNAPTAGNPTKWIAINDNGTTRYIPTWS